MTGIAVLRAVTLMAIVAVATGQMARRSAGSGEIDGVVIDSVTGELLSGITVQLSRPNEGPDSYGFGPSTGVIYTTSENVGRPVMTDHNGRFRVTGLTAGHYELFAYGAGGTGSYGGPAASPESRLSTLADGQRRSVQVRLFRNALLRGRVTDERSEPVIGVPVHAMPVTPRDIPNSYLATAVTDDRGVFTLSVPAGRYHVAAIPASAPSARRVLSRPIDGRPSVHVTTLYGGAQTVREAMAVDVEAGALRTDLDIHLTPALAFMISARFSTVDYKTGFETLELAVEGQDRRRPFVVGRIARQGGMIRIDEVPAGRYRLRALLPPVMPMVTHGIAPLRTLPDAPTLWLDLPISIVDRDIVDLDLTPRSGFRLSGAIDFDGPTPSFEQLQSWPLVVEPADDARIDLLGAYASLTTFATIQLPPGDYLLRPLPRDGWFVKSVIAGGRDVTDGAITLGEADRKDLAITLTNRPARLAGNVSQSASIDPFRPWVIVFPAERDRWTVGALPGRIARVQTGRSLKYEATLPPGQYYVAALPGLPNIPDDFARIAAVADVITFTSGSTVNKHLRVIEQK